MLYVQKLNYLITVINIMTSSSQTQPHVLFFPYMARGHTLPILDLATALASHGINVTVVTTPKNAPFILSNAPSQNFSLSIIPFPSPAQSGLPEGCENTHDLPSRDFLLPFMLASSLLREPFRVLLKDMSASLSLPVCVVSDFMHYWTLDVCRSFGVPRLGLHVGGVLPMAILRTAFSRYSPSIFAASLTQSISFHLQQNSDFFKLPFSFNKTDFLDTVLQQDPNNLTPTMGPLGEADSESWGTIINSFHELEHHHIPALQSFYKNPIWCLGPFRLHHHNPNQSQPGHTPRYINWLDEKLAEHGPDSVIYVSFGSEAELSDEQITEIARGLESAGHPFILLPRSATWAPLNPSLELGLVIREWVNQDSILAHPATGGFLTHCGWNSIIESLSMGVPVLGWPIGADQPLNAKIVCYGFEAGLLIPQEFETDESDHKIKRLLIGRETVKDKVRELMGGELGRKVREKAKEIGRSAKQAVERGGSSCTNLDQLIKRLMACSQSN